MVVKKADLEIWRIALFEPPSPITKTQFLEYRLYVCLPPCLYVCVPLAIVWTVGHILFTLGI
jgi:hypothetical protein